MQTNRQLTAGQMMMRNTDAFREHGGDEAPLIDGNVRIGMKWNSQRIAQEIFHKGGAVIQTGPFAGMRYHREVAEGALGARLLGTYEAELHPHIARILATDPIQIVDIGCAEGLYAVGFARLAPFAMIKAFDISPAARDLCAALARMNDVSDRVAVGGEVDHQTLDALAQIETFIFCDIEGGEKDLLDPQKVLNLSKCSLIVETHPQAAPGVTERLTERFSPTHAITQVHERVKPVPEGHWLQDRTTVDQFLATWEWRYRPTPWLIMEPKR